MATNEKSVYTENTARRAEKQHTISIRSAQCKKWKSEFALCTILSAEHSVYKYMKMSDVVNVHTCD